MSASRSSADRALLYMHGGGYAIGSIKSHRHLVAQLCEASGFVGYALDYRLAPETVFPGAVDDAVSAYRALLESKISAQKIVIAGDSAGGGLTAATALALKALGLPQPAGLFCISPWADLSQTGASYAANAERDLIVDQTVLDQWAGLYLSGQSAKTRWPRRCTGTSPGSRRCSFTSDRMKCSCPTRRGLRKPPEWRSVSVELLIAPDMPHVWHFMWAQLAPAREAIARAGAWMRSCAA